MATSQAGESRGERTPDSTLAPAFSAVSADPSRPAVGALLIHAVTRPALRVFLWLVALTVVATRIFALPRRVLRLDFSIFYSTSAALRRGLNPYTCDLRPIAAQFHMDIGRLIHTTSTPTFLLMFEPLALLPPRAAYWTWFAVSATAFVAAAILLLRDRAAALDRAQTQVFAALMLIYMPTSVHLIFAQAQFIILMLLIVMMRGLRRGNDLLAGVAFALAAALRAFPFVMAAYLIVKRRWRVLFFGALALAAIELITIATLGWPIFSGFIRFALHAPANIADIGVRQPSNASLSPFITRIFWYAFGLALDPMLNRVRALTAVAAELGVIALAVRATLREPANRDSDSRAFGLWIAVTLLVSPITWIHYFVLLLVPFHSIASATAAGRCPRGAIWVALASYAVMMLAPGLHYPTRTLNGYVLYSPKAEFAFVALALAWVASLLSANAAPIAADSASTARPVRAESAEPA